ncbi:MarR family winged helix-turn-helix transcriptional regulator [Blastococcus sp. SYSU DS0533]
MDTPWLEPRQMRAWVRLIGLLELLPGVLDAQLRRDAAVTHFEYYVLAVLSEAPGRTLRMTDLARHTNATLPRLSHVISRLETRGLVERHPCPEDRRATDARLTDAGWAKVREAAPGHAANVRHHVVDPLDDDQVDQLTTIADAILARLDPSGAMKAVYTRYDELPGQPGPPEPSP